MQFEYRLHWFLEWSLVGEEKECGCDEIYVGRKEAVGGCVTACYGRSSMFIFGTNDYGVTRCWEKGCSCICELAASLDGTCQRTGHNGYRLYRYEKGMIEKY